MQQGTHDHRNGSTNLQTSFLKILAALFQNDNQVTPATGPNWCQHPPTATGNNRSTNANIPALQAEHVNKIYASAALPRGAGIPLSAHHRNQQQQIAWIMLGVWFCSLTGRSVIKTARSS
jgi:hypothetical protein